MVAVAELAVAVVLLPLCEAGKLGFLVWRLEGSSASVESVTKAFVSGPGRSWWSMDEEGHRHVQPKIYTVKKNTAIAPKHLLLTFQIGLGLYIHLCQQISLL